MRDSRLLVNLIKNSVLVRPVRVCSGMVSVREPSWKAICRSLEESGAEETGPSSLWKAQRVQLTAGVVALLVDRPLQLPDAIRTLRASMTDQILGLDLEWKPDRYPGSNNPVALIQIASTTCCLLVRTGQLQFQLSNDLLQLLRSDAAPTTPTKTPMRHF